MAKEQGRRHPLPPLRFLVNIDKSGTLGHSDKLGISERQLLLKKNSDAERGKKDKKGNHNEGLCLFAT